MTICEITMAKSGSNLWWIGYAKSLRDRGLMPIEEIKPYIRKLRAMDHKTRNSEIFRLEKST